MAIQIQNNPNAFVRVYDTNIANFKVYDPDFIQVNFKFVFKLYDGSTLKATSKISPDNVGMAYYNPTQYIQSLISSNVPSTDNLYVCSNSYKNITTKVWVEYGDPVVEYTGTTQLTNYYYNGTQIYENYDYVYGNDYWVVGSSNQGRFLTPVNEFNLDTTEKMWLYFNVSANTSANIVFKSYNSSGLLGSSSKSVYLSGNTMYSFGCGPANLISGITLSSGYTYYTVHLSLGSGGEEDFFSEIITINYEYKCDRYDYTRVYWLNEHGGWSNFLFNKKKYINVKYNRSIYDRFLGYNYSTNSTLNTQRGLSQYNLDINEIITLNTKYIDDNETTLIESLLNSADVRVLETINGVDLFIPYIVVNTDFNKKNNSDDRLYGYSIDIQKATQKITQKF